MLKKLIAGGGLLALLASTVAAGIVFGGRAKSERISMVFATSVRNVGVSLVAVAAKVRVVRLRRKCVSVAQLRCTRCGATWVVRFRKQGGTRAAPGWRKCPARRCNAHLLSKH